jgi:hypothetical protein
MDLKGAAFSPDRFIRSRLLRSRPLPQNIAPSPDEALRLYRASFIILLELFSGGGYNIPPDFK